MACDDSRMAQEGVVTQVLSGTAQYKIEDNTLTLMNNDMVLVFRLCRVTEFDARCKKATVNQSPF
jgi:heat shock protein HslJ